MKQIKKKNSIKIIKYPYLSIFNTTRCDWKLSKEKKLRLEENIRKIKVLAKEMEELFEVENENKT